MQVQLFAHLTVAKVINAQTMYDLLRSFSAVLDEFGVSHGRAKKSALCAAEGLMIVRKLLIRFPSTLILPQVWRYHKRGDECQRLRAHQRPTGLC